MILAAVMFLPWLGTRDLWNPNEPIYGQAVAEMAQQGEWLVPTVNGLPFLEKPILYFWAARLTGAIGGVNEWTLRLPSLFSVLVTLVFVYLLGCRLGGRFRGRASALLTITIVSVAWSARQVQMDSLATAAVAAIVYFGLSALERPTERRVWWIVGTAAGIGLLAKGPVVWICAAIPLFGWAVTERIRPRFRSRCVGAALLGLAAPIALWFGPLAYRGELGLMHETFLRQNFTRFLEPWDHVQPWWYFLKYLWIDMAPWSWLLPLAVGRRAWTDRLDRLAWIWLIGIMVFLSFSGSKRSAYLMPAAPAVALLVSGLVERWFRGGLAVWRRRGVWGFLILFDLLFVVGAWFAYDSRDRYPAFVGELGLLTLILSLAAAALAGAMIGRRRELRAPLTFLSTFVLLLTFLSGWLLPRVDPIKSARGFSGAVREVVADDSIVGYRLWVWRAEYTYYLGRAIGRLENTEELAAFWQQPERGCVIVEEKRAAEFSAQVGELEPRVSRMIGMVRVELFCNR